MSALRCLRLASFARRALAGVLLALLPPAVRAQNQAQADPPHLGYIYPAGARQGTTVRVCIGGQRLRGAEAVHVSPAAGITAKFVDYERPLTVDEANQARDEARELEKRRRAAQENSAAKWTDADEKKLSALRSRSMMRANRLPTPAVGETVTVEITVAPDAAPGVREIRVLGAIGLSNPFAFHIGDLPEFSEPVVKGTSVRDAPGTRSRAALDISLPVTVNGQILGGEVDRYRFEARRGQQLTVIARARALIPYLADAVPGWFQATLALYDDEGRELAYRDDYRFDPDPVLAYTIPADGRYTIEIKDSIHRGREDFVYRLSLGELPFITSVFPLGTTPTAPTRFALRGWNLQSGDENGQIIEHRDGFIDLSVQRHGFRSNAVRVHVDPLTPTLEAEPNDTADAAPLLTLPALVDGRIGRPDDIEIYRFTGRAGEPFVAEVLARRLDSPLDSRLELLDPQGAVIASNDDCEDKAAGLLTHHADSRLEIKLPADGIYAVRLRDVQHRGGDDYAYRLRLGPPRPDFELRVSPATINARAGGSVPLTVYAVRRDGFTGEIALGLIEAPPGFALSGPRIPAGQDKVQLTLTAASTVPREPTSLKVAGRALIGGQPVIHFATPAEDMMQAFAYQHLVPARELVVYPATRGSGVRTAQTKSVALAAGGQGRVQLRTGTLREPGPLHVALVNPPTGVTIADTRQTGDGVEVTLACEANAPATAGNLIFSVTHERPPTGKQKRPRRTPLGCAPAIPFTLTAGSGS